jgi:imidazolonepropionase-like amidohydrolase
MEPYAWAERAVPIFKATTAAMHRAGIPIAVGTDAGGPVGYNFQGYNTPREVELLVESGLTPMEAIVAATRRGAELLGAADRLGTIAPGKLADLLILSASPLDDIANLRRIEHVMLEGTFYPREQLAVKAAR